MVKISKEERNWLVANGVNTGDNGISKTHTTHGKRIHYYMCESKRNCELLQKYRDSILVK